ncbi:MAG: 4-hydroxybenzoate octaprenyltransferase [Pseudomonadota bacterium]
MATTNKSTINFLYLMRLHQPTGICLLLLPCWWGILFLNKDFFPLKQIILFSIGAIVMRSFGCIVNDIIDRDFDAKVERTKNRPLASGAISVKQAMILAAILLVIAFIIALQMNLIVIILAFLSLIPVIAYPFMKRITWFPQAFLGITFNLGILLGFASVRDSLNLPIIIFYLASIFWTIGYDTIYAHQDKKDDAKIGVKSTALACGSKKSISMFYAIAFVGWILAGIIANMDLLYYVGLSLAMLHFAWQITSVDLDNPTSCMRIFKSNTIFAVIILFAISLG